MNIIGIGNEHPSFPTTVQAGHEKTPEAWLSTNQDWLRNELLSHGSVLLRGFEFNDVGRFESFFRAAFGDLLEYRERSSPRNRVEGRIYTSTEYPPDQPIFLHNENSYQREFPLRIGFYCSVPPATQGETPIADVRRVLNRIPGAIRKKFETHKVLYVRNFGEHFGLSWQTVFQTESRTAVEEYCRKTGIEVEWKPDGGLRTKQIRPAIASHPITGELTWFNHATFFHISTLPADVQETLLAEFSLDELPMNSYYGNGENIEPAVLDELRSAYSQETAKFSWREHDVMILDNMFVAHAREPFRGNRKILVAMAQAHTRSA